MSKKTEVSALSSTYIYVQGTTGEPRLVDALIFEGSAPSWFSHTFGPRVRRPTPIYTLHDIPVFAIPLPAQIFDEMLHGLRFPDLLPDMLRHVPQKIKNEITAKTWQRYLVDMQLDRVEAKDDGDDDDDEARHKRRRIETEDKKKKAHEALLQSPRGKLLVRMGTALAARIKAEHPGWPDMANGVYKALAMDFVNTFDNESDEGPYADMLALPGDPPAEPVNMAWMLSFHINSSDEKDIFRDALATGLKDVIPNIRVFEMSYVKRKTQRKTKIAIKYWPSAARGHLITPGEHDMLHILLNIKKPDGMSDI